MCLLLSFGAVCFEFGTGRVPGQERRVVVACDGERKACHSSHVELTPKSPLRGMVTIFTLSQPLFARYTKFTLSLWRFAGTGRGRARP